MNVPPGPAREAPVAPRVLAGLVSPHPLYPGGAIGARGALVQNLENIFQRIDNEFRDLKNAENTNVEELRKTLNRQAEAIAYLATRLKELEQRANVEAEWDEEVDEVIKLMALDDAKIWKFRKHKEIYEEIARKGVGEAAETL